MSACKRSPSTSEEIAPEPTQSGSDFRSFWGEFRTTVLDGDPEATEELTRFPFRTRGPLDDSVWVSYNRSDFRALLPTLLDQDSGERPEADPMRELIQRTTATDHLDVEGGEIHLGSFVFESVDDRSLFTRAYVDRE